MAHHDDIRGRLLDSVREHEGFRARPYRDSVGVLTIGYGTNLETISVSPGEATAWMVDRLEALRAKLRGHEWYARASEVRRDVLLEMAYQLGYRGLLKFRKMIDALEEGNYWAAASEGLDSRWGREQSPGRAVVLMDRMRTGKWKAGPLDPDTEERGDV